MSMNNLKTSSSGRKHLAKWEGLRLKPYKDVAGYLTIGVGHLITAKEREDKRITIDGVSVDYLNGLTPSQVDTLLSQDLDIAERAVNKYVRVPLAQHQFDALVSFTFNLGSGNLRKSTLLKLLNKEDYASVPKQLMRWVKAGGRTVRGLVNRRRDEAKLWRSSETKSAVTSRTNQGSLAITAGAATAAIADATAVKDAVSSFTHDMGEVAQWIGFAVVFIGVAYVIYARWDDKRNGIR